MQITINPKIVKRCIGEMLEFNLYDEFIPQALKAAGAPKKSDLVEQLYADPKFISELGKYLAEYLSNSQDVIYDAACDVQSPVVKKLYKDCEKAQDKIEADRRKDISDEDMAKMRKTLEAAGYHIVNRVL